MTDGRTTGAGMRISDPQVMRALAHPARIEIMDHLNSTGAVVTATETAALVGLSPSASSYHLRELAKYGLVEQAPSRGDGRERVWRSTGTGLRIEGEADEPEAMAAEHELIDAYVVRDFNRTREWAARQGQESKEWREASSLMSQKLLLTAGELAAVNEQVSALLEPYRMRGRLAAPPDGGREVAVFYAAFPTR